MQARIITLSNNKDSFTQADRCIDSSNHFGNSFTISKYIATIPSNVVDNFKSRGIKWNYPWTKSHLDIQSGLYKTVYETADPAKRMSCFMSHYRLWEECAEKNEDFLVLEHDALFVRRLKIETLEESSYKIISINDPRGATRRSQAYHELICEHEIAPVPWIDDAKIPQGLPGNSAYYLKPEGAMKLLLLVKEYGGWPNDAIMCKQLLSAKTIGCLGKYATVVQKTHSSSTTT